MQYELGQRLHLIGEGIHGEIRGIELDDNGNQESLVIACDDGQWTSVEIKSIEAVTVH